MDFTDNLTKYKMRKSQFNLSVSLTPGELSAIFDTAVAQPKSNCKINYFTIILKNINNNPLI